MSKEVHSSTVAFESGAVRSADAEGTAYTLLSPVGLRRAAMAAKEGEIKYSAYNWEKGMPLRDLLEHVIRHAYAYLAGDRSEDHLGHATWGMMAACHSEEKWPHLNDGTLRGPDCTPPQEPLPVATTQSICDAIRKSCGRG